MIVSTLNVVIKADIAMLLILTNIQVEWKILIVVEQEE